jgi:uncharacterized delta-60 repeat protein
MLVLLLTVAGVNACSDPNAPTTKPSQLLIERTWYWFNEDSENWFQFYAADQDQPLVVSERNDFGSHSNVPPGREPAGFAEIYSNSTGTTYWAQAQAPEARPDNDYATTDGGTLQQDMSFVVDQANPSLKFTVTALKLETLDYDPSRLTPRDCGMNIGDPDFPSDCDAPLIAAALFGIGATTNWLSDPFYGKASTVILAGAIKGWGWSVGVYEEQGEEAEPAFRMDQFTFNDDVDGDGSEGHATVTLNGPVTFDLPLADLQVGDTFDVTTVASAVAVDVRQLETFAGAYLRDPLNAGGTQLAMNGIHQVPTRPRNRQPRPADACTGSPAAGGTIQLSAASYKGPEGRFLSDTVEVTRVGGNLGDASVSLTLSSGSASAGQDYQPFTTLIRFGNGQEGPRTIMLPILRDTLPEDNETITVTLSDLRGCATLGSPNTATFTIRDDDRQAPTTYTLGGTVTGLTGTGLTIRDQLSGNEMSPANGPFTLATGLLDGASYDVVIQTLPVNPLQACTIANGTGTVTHANVTNIAVTCVPQVPTGDLDPTFGSGGRMAFALPGGATAMRLQADGKIVVAGASLVQRFKADGSVDSTFGTAGQAPFTFAGALTNSPLGIAIQSDGKIVVAGSIVVGNREDCAVARYTGSGTLDAGFGSGGKTIVDFRGTGSRCTGVALQSGDRIVLGGQAAYQRGVFINGNFAVARLSASGAPDSTFGLAGIDTTTVLGDADGANAITVDANDRIILAGHGQVSGGSDPIAAVVRYTANGIPDSSFNSTGVVASSFAAFTQAKDFYSVLVQPGGRIVAAGQIQVNGVYNFLLAGYTSSGQPDVGFGAGGVLFTALTSQGDVGRGMTAQADGKLLVVGRAALFGVSDFGIARYSADGIPDSSFGSGGEKTVDFLSANDGAVAVGVQPSGRIIVGGFAKNGATVGVGLAGIAP